ncbi:MAG: hypothetical protein A2Z21_03485 [Candidatus Fraserbacteria bacterium RBG_16_55_9]|uniref:Uncharacterized protein n=1 Tax=Fraserbacteria sp. (strain RBG_16_55_9) TaxID=1817864 RepID=A0A1F5URK2_FRAXR|nr:MAG: hypothetical protein A2Z21_03485 [Candidatus Fraserbacteria bacterium RBG_16_55_9]
MVGYILLGSGSLILLIALIVVVGKLAVLSQDVDKLSKQIELILKNPPAVDSDARKQLREAHALSPPKCTDADYIIEWSQAKNYMGENCTVRGEIKQIKRYSSEDVIGIFIDIGNKFPSADRFSAVIWKDISLSEEVAVRRASIKNQG